MTFQSELYDPIELPTLDGSDQPEAPTFWLFILSVNGAPGGFMVFTGATEDDAYNKLRLSTTRTVEHVFGPFDKYPEGE